MTTSTVAEFSVARTWESDRRGPIRWLLSHVLRHKILAQYGFQGGQIKRWQVASMQVANADFTPTIAFICHLRPSTCPSIGHALQLLETHQEPFSFVTLSANPLDLRVRLPRSCVESNRDPPLPEVGL